MKLTVHVKTIFSNVFDIKKIFDPKKIVIVILFVILNCHKFCKETTAENVQYKKEFSIHRHRQNCPMSNYFLHSEKPCVNFVIFKFFKYSFEMIKNTVKHNCHKNLTISSSYIYIVW